MPLRPRVTAAAPLAAAFLIAACGDAEPTKAQKDAAKKEQDARLLALTYPKSAGLQPRTLQTFYDAATDRTFTSLTLSGLRVTGTGAQQVSSVALHLTSSHKGRVRAPGNPEGSVDAGIVAQTAAAGTLAFSGPPGTLHLPGRKAPMKMPTDADEYTSTRAGAGREESVRFRIPTEDLIAALEAGDLTISVGTIQLQANPQQLAELREFAAKLNPNP